MNKKIVGISVCILFIGAGFVSGTENMSKKSFNNTIVVDDEGDGDYTSIQEAIDNANNGDTIEVYSGSYYDNEMIVNKKINFIGIENELPPNGNDYGKPVIYSFWSSFYIISDGVMIDGFSFHGSEDMMNWAIVSFGNYTIITDNIIFNCFTGVDIDRSNNIISNNNIYNCSYAGIQTWLEARENTIENNIIENIYNFTNIGRGINLYGSKDSIVKDNIIKNCNFGVMFSGFAENNIIYKNNIVNNINGISDLYTDEWAYPSYNNYISCNDLVENTIAINHSWGSINNCYRFNNLINNYGNVIDNGINKYNLLKLCGNYWDDYTQKYPNANKKIFRPNIWNTPYEINNNNKDNYPLVKTNLNKMDLLINIFNKYPDLQRFLLTYANSENNKIISKTKIKDNINIPIIKYYKN